MFALGAAALALAWSEDVSEYFPLDFGRTWVYQDTGQSLGSCTDSVGVEQEIAGVKATPIVTTIDGKVEGSTFYRIEDGAVLVVAFQQNKPLAAPYAIVKLGPGKTSWSSTGSTQWYGEFAPLKITGSSKRGPKTEFQSEKYDTLEVTLDAVIGADNGAGMKSHQVYLYARGVGLVKMTETTTVNKTKLERRRKLVSFTPGKSG